MKFVIAFAHKKGGVGKSTLAINTALELAQKYSVTFLDLDSQASATYFNAMREKDGVKTLDMYNPKTPTQVDKLLDDLNNIVIVDTGGYDNKNNRTALLKSDMIITPVSLSHIEKLGLEDFKKVINDLKKENEDIVGTILLNNINPNTKREIEDFKKWIKEDEQIWYYDMFDTIIRTRQDFKSSFQYGLTVSELDADSKASLELKAFIKEIEEIINN